ncbi:MAG: type II/IV secretion system protein [Clostridia bacterium]|nr:type II/IV secretion system protein [Clostridia bacterium]
MEANKRGPIGIELVKRGLISQSDINKALDYQRKHPEKKIVEIIRTLNLCNEYVLLETLGEILNEKTIMLTQNDVQVNINQYISLDVANKYKVVPFQVNGNKIKVCFSDTLNKEAVDTVKLILLNKGLTMEKYITFEKNVMDVLKNFEGNAIENIESSGDATTLVDSIIRTAMKKRASDIHIEPLEDTIRVRYRIDGELIKATEIKKEKQQQLIGRLKSISNMFQEKQESQDGRIVLYPDYNIRVSSQKNIYGEKFVLRLLKKNMTIRGLQELGFPATDDEAKKIFNKRNSITIVAAPTGEGKTTTLYSIIDSLNRPGINITTIEDPVEIHIKGLNQIEIDEKLRFADSLRTVLRQDPDIILVGEIRDKETAEIAMQAGQTGHYVLSTIHTIDAIEVITRLRKMGLSDYDIASTIANIVSQRLIRKVCPHCAKKREFTDSEKEIISKINEKYNVKTDLTDKFTYDIVGCDKCNGSGYYDRIAIFEILELNDELKELIIKNESSLEIKKKALECGYKPFVVDAMDKVIYGQTTLDEVNRKLIIF